MTSNPHDTHSSSASSAEMGHTDGYKLDFEPGYYQLLEHSFRVSRDYVSGFGDSGYHFPASAYEDLKKYCRFDARDVILIALLTVAWTLLRWLFTEVIFKPTLSYCQVLPADRKKAPESCWKLLFYSGTVAYNGYLLFCTEEYNFFHRPGYVWEGWSPGMVVRPEVYFYYMLQGSFYIHSIFATIFMDQWRKDSIAMIVHHLITSWLIFMSYGLRYCNIGLLVFMLHDVTDVELEFTKLNVYFKRRGNKVHTSNDYISVGGFIMFTLTWMFSRLYWFPTRALYTAGVLAVGKFKLPFSSLLTFLLWLLFILNIYWFLYIVIFLVKVVTGQVKELVDTREFEGGYESPSNGKSKSVMNGNGKSPNGKAPNGHNGLHKASSNDSTKAKNKLHQTKKKN